MDIGEEKPAIVVEPIEDPFKTEPTPARETRPQPEPQEVPAHALKVDASEGAAK